MPDSRSDVADSASSAGNASVLTFSPTPSTAQPSCGRPSTRIPATLRPSIQTSFGHLIVASTGTASADGNGGCQRQHLVQLAQHHRHQHG